MTGTIKGVIAITWIPALSAADPVCVTTRAKANPHKVAQMPVAIATRILFKKESIQISEWITS
ncbi:hypothetical protein D3C84_708930 [compost metagenome]